MKQIEVRIVNNSDITLPQYETEGAACMDIRANHTMVILGGSRGVVPTGLFVEIPVGYQIKVVPRSGLAAKQGVTVLNSPGTIDSDYRGEIGVIIINHNTEPLRIEEGDRIAQIELQEVIKIKWNPVLLLSETERGNKGFGSTKVK